MSAKILVSTDHVTVRFPRPGAPDLVASRAVSLHIATQETLGLVGESGSGKTTMGRTLVRLLTPSAGTVWFEGKDVTHIHGSALMRYHRNAQMIFQDPFASLNPFHTVGHHLARPLARLRHLKGHERQEALDELLTLVGLTPSAVFREKYPHELSGGQRQRVAIARALAGGPSFIVADEPVSMLDVSLRAEILTLLESLQERRGLSYLYITHDLASARYLSHRIAVMYGGSLVEIATAEELVQAPAHPYTRLLLAATPGSPHKGPLPETMQGAPDLSADRIGCPFAPRCPSVMDQCSQVMPELKAVSPSHQAACFLNT
ncbi:dipeptide/oligopeptide/nickel ABC transporter ATP-binding protein [Sulfobacillus thermotolerans]|uniref:Dipeptide/oligopeptide/nickel ABC transporter ATP-binding protein n=1 Tax=Sulfobacillus thermotolerans TaxID=338644 RepID=A0ABN5GY14_9FIRM|nr:dipeptide/oligopeptide/nickel ABC transporter ATP-binding protein [Sulfobacillus thermotolerans]